LYKKSKGEVCGRRESEGGRGLGMEREARREGGRERGRGRGRERQCEREGGSQERPPSNTAPGSDYTVPGGVGVEEDIKFEIVIKICVKELNSVDSKGQARKCARTSS